MVFSPQFLDELRARLAVSEIVGRRLALTRAGREHKGLCPFHKEKTPSFTVSDDKGFFHCFGCGAHGDVITFVMRAENLSFHEAIEKLAAEAGLEVPVADARERERAKMQAGLAQATEAACAWFEKQLWLPEGARARVYLAERGLDEVTIRRFRLGFAPGGRGGLKGALAREGLGPETLVEAGLLRRPDDGRDPYDYFRDRITFPITERRGRVIAFGGRTLGEGEPKYLNSPETPLFQKGRVLYGLAQARDAMLKRSEIVVVEGYMDVIALNMAGIEHAVAPLGTALTERQILELWRLAPEPVLCFDGDAAGARAAARAADRALVLLKPGLSLRFAMLPTGEDPDTMIARGGVEAVDRLIAEARPLAKAVWLDETADRALDTPERRALAKQRLFDRARQIGDRTVQEQYLNEFRGWFDATFGGSRWSPGRRREADAVRRLPPAPRPASAGAKHERILMAVILNHPGLFAEVGEELGRLGFSDNALDRLRQAVLALLGGAKDLDSVGSIAHLQQSGHGDVIETVLNQSTYRDAYFARPMSDPEDARQGWREIASRIKLQELKAELAQVERDVGENPTESNLARRAELQRYVSMIEAGEGAPEAAGTP